MSRIEREAFIAEAEGAGTPEDQRVMAGQDATAWMAAQGG